MLGVFFLRLPSGEKMARWVGVSPMVVSQNFSSATSLAMLAPISTLMGMPRRSPITSEMSFSPLGPSSTPWAQDGAQDRCLLPQLRASHPEILPLPNSVCVSVPPQRSSPSPAQPELAVRRAGSIFHVKMKASKNPPATYFSKVMYPSTPLNTPPPSTPNQLPSLLSSSNQPASHIP